MGKKKVEFKSDNGNVYMLDKKLGEGGQGQVYQVINQNDKKKYALKWYNQTFGTPEQRNQIQSLINRGTPKIDINGIQFIWPIEIVTVDGKESFGYIMPLYDNNRYINLNCVISGKKKQPSIDILSRISYKIAIALESIHKAGYAYCDINPGNIQFDFNKGDIIVCDNDNVVVNNSKPAIDGVMDFMAPEVALGKSKPNSQSDLYSLAILLFQLWVWEHPMEGKITNNVRCWDLPAKKKYYAEKPIFAYHPTDKENSAESVDMYKYGVIRWETYCSQRLKEVFIKSFTEGVEYPNKRISLREWKNIFIELEANCIKCPQCGAVNHIDVSNLDYPHLNVPGGISQGPSMKPNASGEITCFYCRSQFPINLKMNIKNDQEYQISNLIVYSGVNLRLHHIDNTAANKDALTQIGSIEAHPKNKNAYILRNKTKYPWFYKVGGKSYRIDPGQARALLPDGKLIIGSAKIDIQKI